MPELLDNSGLRIGGPQFGPTAKSSDAPTAFSTEHVAPDANELAALNALTIAQHEPVDQLLIVNKRIESAALQCGDPKLLHGAIHQCDAIRNLLHNVDATLVEQNQICATRIRIARRIGQIITSSISPGGDRKSKSQAATLKLADLGLTKSQSSRFQCLAVIPSELFEGEIRDANERCCELTTTKMVRLANRLKRLRETKEKLGKKKQPSGPAPDCSTSTSSIDPLSKHFLTQEPRDCCYAITEFDLQDLVGHLERLDDLAGCEPWPILKMLDRDSVDQESLARVSDEMQTIQALVRHLQATVTSIRESAIPLDPSPLPCE